MAAKILEKAEDRLIFRDKLAIERTMLARERTTMAYIRTGLSLIGVGLFLYKFIELEETLNIAVTLLITAPGVALTVGGLYKTAIRRSKRKAIINEYYNDLK
jgi:putative membrane protein